MDDFSEVFVIEYYLEFAERFQANNQIVNTTDFLQTFLNKEENIVFEGAQGALLDTDWGFFPHVTATTCTTKNAEEILSKIPHKFEQVNVGILRTYFHRHGAGPFVSEVHDKAYKEQVPELHNAVNIWQGHFRVGYLDLVALKYGISLNTTIHCLSVTHLDRIPIGGDWVIVLDYKYNGSMKTEYLSKYLQWKTEGENVVITGINANKECAEVTELLYDCVPFTIVNIKDLASSFAEITRENSGDEYYVKIFLAYIEQQIGRKVYVTSYGPTANDKYLLTKHN